ncbi:unnamed protein product [Prunus armeniaca]|uniref:Lycopene beta-cyclase n=1 Tax=Prunus armeniaca TaxID=36596 RepID=A0A6J5XII2_PRUAR|nr:unnamed protein product [Prunus armeniaca]
MGTLMRLFSPPPPATQSSQFFHSFNPPFSFPRTCGTSSRNTPSKAQSSECGNFLDLKPEAKPEFLDFDIPRFDTSTRSSLDVIIIGTGPAGLRLAEQVSQHGIKVCCVDPSPQSLWPNTYSVWVDEFESLQLESCLEKTWPRSCFYIDEDNVKYIDRPFGRISRKKFKTLLMERCLSNDVKFHKAKVLKIEHQEFESSIFCDDGNELKASLIVDASGFASTFMEYDKPRNHGYQTGHGILAEVDFHPFDLDKVVQLDWRDSHLRNEPSMLTRNSIFPTFLFAMPFDSSLIYLMETSLVGRPVLSYEEVKKRMVARLRHLGIRVKRVMEAEKCLIPMGGPLPRMSQEVMAMGGTSGLVNPSAGYMVASAMALAPVLAEAIVQCLGSTPMIRGQPLYDRAWKGLWPIERRCVREFYSFGMETLLTLDLNETRRFFDAFFDLDPYYLHGYLSSRLSPTELAVFSLSMFGNASVSSRVELLTKSAVPFVKMIGNLALEAKQYYM